MLRMDFVQHWFNLADAACEGALLDSTRFVAVPGPETAVAQRETMLALERCVDAMSGNAGSALLTHDWQGCASPEAGARLGISADYLRTLLHRARKTVRERIRHDWINGKGRRTDDRGRRADGQARHAALRDAQGRA